MVHVQRHNFLILILQVRSFCSQAVLLYQKRSFDRAADWCQLCCAAAEMKNVTIEPGNFAKMFELWGTVLLDGGNKDHLHVAFEAVKKANLKKPSLSGLYTQLRIALENKGYVMRFFKIQKSENLSMRVSRRTLDIEYLEAGL